MTPRGLTLQQAAEYCGVGASTYRRWVDAGLMPEVLQSTRRYDRLAIDAAWNKMSGIEASGGGSEYDQWKAAG